MINPPKFFVALAHTDNIACFVDELGESSIRISNLNLFPSSMKENLLFSLSYPSDKHYDTMQAQLDPLGNSNPLVKHQQSLPRRVFADCGAFQFRKMKEPILPDGSNSSAEQAWKFYLERHINKQHKWIEILLCSPDHIVTSDMSEEDARNRLKFTRDNAEPFFKLASKNQNVTPVGVIHGRDIEERIEQYEMFKKFGYQYVALGGMVPFSTKPHQALKIIAGIEDMENPKISKRSILNRCRQDGIRLHIFGLNSPEWYRWWYRLRIDSFDGSKLSTEGAANGWYWMMNDGKGGREEPIKPRSVSELYRRIAVKKMNAEDWKWKKTAGIMIPEVPLVNGIDTSCDCGACSYLRTHRCTSTRCWMHKKDSSMPHSSDPRMMGSTEHNMGRVAHNAFIFERIVEKIEFFNRLADSSSLEGEDEWLKNWNTIEVDE